VQLLISAQLAQATFSDVEPSYWAQPLSEQQLHKRILSLAIQMEHFIEQPLVVMNLPRSSRDAFSNPEQVRQIPEWQMGI